MKSSKNTPRKSKAQAMVEFAIALPILLMLLYGILETGRFLFLYSTVVTASRQAVRYGSATGIGNGTGNANETRYEDCDGIRQAAKNAGYLGAFADNEITLQYDAGPSTAQTTFCSAGSTTDGSFNPSTANTSRLVVTVSDQFVPIVPKLVPFVNRTITATSARTVLVSVSIQVTAPALTWLASTSTPSNTPTPSPTPTNTPDPATITTIVSASPDPSGRNEDVVVSVTVTGSGPIPTGTVDVDAGGSNTCTITLVNGSGSCTLNFNRADTYTITATYNGDADHSSSNDTESHTVLSGTATPTATSNTSTPTLTPTVTLSPTATLSPTPSFTPTASATPISGCNLVTHGVITYSGSTMSMTINNPTGHQLLISSVEVHWNHDRGHQTGSDKTLRLQSATLGSSLFTGNVYASSYTISPLNKFVPTGASTITFTFHQSYDNAEGTDRIIIYLATNGCGAYPIDSDS